MLKKIKNKYNEFRGAIQSVQIPKTALAILHISCFVRAAWTTVYFVAFVWLIVYCLESAFIGTSKYNGTNPAIFVWATWVIASAVVLIDFAYCFMNKFVERVDAISKSGSKSDD